MEVQSNYQD